MATENERPLEYFAATSEFDWGRGPTVDAALDTARFHLKQDWVNIFIGYDLKPSFPGSAKGEIIGCIKLNLSRYRRKR